MRGMRGWGRVVLTGGGKNGLSVPNMMRSPPTCAPHRPAVSRVRIRVCVYVCTIFTSASRAGVLYEMASK